MPKIEGLDQVFNFKIFLGLVIGIVLFSAGVQAQQSDWLDNNYAARRVITIVNNNDSAEIPINYTICLNIDTRGSNFLNNGFDTRIAYNNTIFLDRINFTNFNRENTTICFMTLNTIPSNSTDQNYSIYYHNPNAETPPTNVSKIYNFSDTFEQHIEGRGLDTQGGWIANNPDVFMVTNYNQNLQSQWEGVQNIRVTSSNNIFVNHSIDQTSQLEVSVIINRCLNASICNASITPANSDSPELNLYEDGTLITGVRLQPTGTNIVAFIDGGTEIIGTWMVDGWHDIRIRMYANNTFDVEFYNVTKNPDGTHNNTLINVSTGLSPENNMTNGINGIELRQVDTAGSSDTTLYDWVRVKKLINPEPSISLEAEEIQTQFFTLCGGISNTTTLNFTLFNEDNVSLSILGDLDISFTSITGINVSGQSASFNFTNQSSFAICIFPEDVNYTVDSIAEYNSSGYVIRHHYLIDATLTNQTQTIQLFTPTSTSTQEVKFIVEDIYNQPVEDVILKVQRFYIGENLYRQVAMGKSDSDGETAIKLKPNLFYTFILESGNNVLRTFEPKFITTSDTSIILRTTAAGLFEYFNYFDTVATSCTYNNDTYILRCTATDTSGLMQEVFLAVEEVRFNTTFTNVCDETGTGSSIILTCNLTNSVNNNRTVRYSFYGRFCCSENVFTTFLTGYITLVPIASSFGTFGVFLVFMVLLPFIFAGRWNPAVSIIFTILIVFVGSMFGLLQPITAMSLMSLAVAGAIIIWKMKV